MLVNKSLATEHSTSYLDPSLTCLPQKHVILSPSLSRASQKCVSCAECLSITTSFQESSYFHVSCYIFHHMFKTTKTHYKKNFGEVLSQFERGGELWWRGGEVWGRSTSLLQIDNGLFTHRAFKLMENKQKYANRSKQTEVCLRQWQPW